ncbi:fluoride efflux transporter CrcB [Aestuariimicrobium ganziense]|uniref:fluoride efflux transporter CrcB n=1 Tax=Aestuariimicrobium ganziense TaxID=2773677 RepID=UPI001F42D17C|nr:fluoride efflux transporter CrcB [Aestuariimicrobium ganziense]
MLLLAVSLAGGLGALARYLVDGAVAERHRGAVPLGTLVVNVVGSFLLGLLVGWQSGRAVPADWTIVAGVGFLGGFTTFSTACVEVVWLARRGRVRTALALGVGMLVLALLAAAAGVELGGSSQSRV